MKDKLIQSQQGNVLIYALLTIAAILSSSIVISNIIQSTVVNSGLISSSQAAFYSAESGTERALYEIRKNNKLPQDGDCKVGDLSCDLTVSNQAVMELNFDLLENQSMQFDLFNVEKNSVGCGIESVSFEWGGATTWLEVSVVEWPGDFLFLWPSLNGNEQLSELPAKKFLYSSSSINNYIKKFYNYRVRVKALYGDATNLKIKNYRMIDGVMQVPFSNFLTLETVGTYRNSTHKLSVEMPRYSSLLGLFDYVLFSESSITK